MTPIPNRLRQQVTDRARRQCEYCQTQALIVIEMHIDHIHPTSAGGTTTPDNLCLTCPHCNNAKSDHRTGIDPVTAEEVKLFNPRIQTWVEHFQWSNEGTQLNGLTPVGRATVDRLEMNAPPVMRARQMWVRAGWHPPRPPDEAQE